MSEYLRVVCIKKQAVNSKQISRTGRLPSVYVSAQVSRSPTVRSSRIPLHPTYCCSTMSLMAWAGRKLGLDDGHGNLLWNPADVPDQTGKIYVVTGGNSGIGREVAKVLMEKGAHVIIAARNLEKCKAAVEDLRRGATAEAPASPDSDQPFRTSSTASTTGKLPANAFHGVKGKVEAAQLDLSSLESIQAFAKKFIDRGLPLHGLVNNAGLFLPPNSKTEWGSEITIGVNYVGHFLLTHLLLGALRSSAPSRVIWVSSPAERAARPNPNDPMGYGFKDSGLSTYGTSKVYKHMAATEMQRRGWRANGVDHFIVQPGLVGSNLMEMSPASTKLDPYKPSSYLMWLEDKLFSQSPEKGCWSTLYALTKPELTGEGGAYYGPLYVLFQPLNMFNTAKMRPSCAQAQDADATRKLYDNTVQQMKKLLGGKIPNALMSSEE